MANYKSSYTNLKEKLAKLKEWIMDYQDIIHTYENALWDIAWLQENELEKAPEIAKMALIREMEYHKNETR